MNTPYPIGINPVPPYREWDEQDAREIFIDRRATELAEISNAHSTINKLLNDDRMHDQIADALAHCLYQDHRALMRTLDSCLKALARQELEEGME